MSQKPECMINLKFPETVSGTGVNETQTLSIKPCDLCRECYVKGNKFWCNHCVDTYMVIENIVENNKSIPKQYLIGICMRYLRGKVSGVLCETIIDLLTKEGNES